MEITAAGHQVVVEAPESLDRVAAKAMEVWSATESGDLVRGFGFAGTAAEIGAGPLPAELTLPARMTEGTYADEHTRPLR